MICLYKSEGCLNIYINISDLFFFWHILGTSNQIHVLCRRIKRKKKEINRYQELKKAYPSKQGHAMRCVQGRIFPKWTWGMALGAPWAPGPAHSLQRSYIPKVVYMDPHCWGSMTANPPHPH